MAFKIYTKTGDAGNTGLIGGVKVSKADLRIDAYGNLDELNAWIGFIKTVLESYIAKSELVKHVQDQLFVVGSHLATAPGNTSFKLPVFDLEIISQLEADIDEMDKILPPLKYFVLPGGNAINAQMHIARCVCRRAERGLVALNNKETIDPNFLKFINRLSDWIFTLSRWYNFQNKQSEVFWIPEK